MFEDGSFFFKCVTNPESRKNAGKKIKDMATDAQNIFIDQNSVFRVTPMEPLADGTPRSKWITIR